MKGESSIVAAPTDWRLHLRFLGMPWLVLSAGLMAFLFFAFVICRMAEFPFWMASWWFAALVAVVAGMTAMFLSPGSDAEFSDFSDDGMQSRNRRDFERARRQCLESGPNGPSAGGEARDIRVFDFLQDLIQGSYATMVGFGFAISWVCLTLEIFGDQVLNSSVIGGPYDPNSSGIVPTTTGWGLLVTLLFAGVFPLITVVPLRNLRRSTEESVSLWTLWRETVPHGVKSYSLLNCLDGKGAIDLEALEYAYRNTSRAGRNRIGSLLTQHQRFFETKDMRRNQSAACLDRLTRIEQEEGDKEAANRLGARAYESALREFLMPGGEGGKTPAIRDFVSDEAVITSLDLSGTDCHSEALGNLLNKAGIKELNLSGTHLSGLRANAFSGFGSLEKLDVSYSSISAEAATGLASLTGLKTLNLAGGWPFNEQVTNNFLRSLAKLRGLESLDLSRRAGSTRAFGDEAVPCLLELKRLKRLDLNGSHLTDEGYRKLIRGLNLNFIGFMLSTVEGGGKTLAETGADTIGLTLTTTKALRKERPELTTRCGNRAAVGSGGSGAGVAALLAVGLFFLLPAIISEVGSITARKQLILELAESLAGTDSRPEARDAKGSLTSAGQTREKRIEALAEYGRQAIAAVPALRKAFLQAWDAGDRRTYKLVVEALGRIDPHGSADFFVEQFVRRCSADEDDDTLVRGLKKWVAHLAIPGLEKALDHESQAVRSNAVQLIGDIGGPTVSVPTLVKLAENGTKEDRKSVIDALKELVRRESGKYRRNAKQALEKLER